MRVCSKVLHRRALSRLSGGQPDEVPAHPATQVPNDSIESRLEEPPRATGEERLGATGWQVGKHN